MRVFIGVILPSAFQALVIFIIAPLKQSNEPRQSLLGRFSCVFGRYVRYPYYLVNERALRVEEPATSFISGDE